MKQKRGPKSGAALTIVSDGNNTDFLPDKPKAPRELTDEESAVWDSVIDTHEQDWLSADQRPVLVQYCRHAISAKRMAQLIQAEQDRKDFDWPVYKEMLASQERESRAIIAAARSLRITNQSRYQNTNAKARPTTGGTPPWRS